LRIPLPEDQYVGFYRDFETVASPLVLSAFVSTVERGVTRCLARGLEAKARSGAELVVRRRPVEVYRTRAAAAAGKG
jgi:hypothetical protein